MITVVLVALLALCEAQDARVVSIAQGSVRGYRTNESGIFEFYGIPYATAPKGTEKFKPPLAAPTWSDTLDATDGLIACPQYQPFAFGLNIQEDCLVANVFTPETDSIGLPVLVYIHGGAFILGFSQEYSPKLLAESKKIVAVTFNYRLGAHGFLCLGTEDVPGNAGLKDMLAALRWVKANIASFGGNPDDVTLAGYSAGATAVELLMLSKAAEGLFNKAIPESASGMAAMGLQMDPVKTAREYAQRLNFEGNFNEMEEFYKTISYDDLLSDIAALNYKDSCGDFVPCLEIDLGQERIVEDHPVNIIKRGDFNKVPMLYGFANMEGMYRLDNFDSWAGKMNENFAEFLPCDLTFENGTEKEAVAETVKQFYFGDKSVGLYTVFDFIDFFSDVVFVYPILRSARMQAEAGTSVYLYEYSFYNNFPSIPGVPDVLVNFPGANHCAQTGALQDMTRTPTSAEAYTEEYRQMRTKMQELWINFVTTGSPVPEGSEYPAWPPADSTLSPHMALGHSIVLGGRLLEARAQLWDGVYDKYYRQAVPPVADGAAGLVGSVGLTLALVFLVC